MKKLIALLLCGLMLTGVCTAAAQEGLLIAPAPQWVTVRIEDCDRNLFYGQVLYTEGMTALEAALAAVKQAGLEAVTQESPYGGMYIASIGTRKEGDFGGYEGWMYYVDGQSPMYNIASCPMSPGQQLLVAYADMSVLQPLVALKTEGEALQVEVTADVTTYDENWNATVTRLPIAGATVTADGVAYTTDEQGCITLSAESAAKERISLQVEQYSDQGLPLVLRLAPDFTLELERKPAFADVADDAWYSADVQAMVKLGLMDGVGEGRFAPESQVTRAMVAQVLYRHSGSVPAEGDMMFTDVADDVWYAEAVRWAGANGVLEGYENGTVRPEAYVTRQDLAVMLMRYRTRVIKKELPDLGFDAPAFADNGAIATYAAEAVYLLQKAGVVQGSGDKFLPENTASRAVLCKMVNRLISVD